MSAARVSVWRRPANVSNRATSAHVGRVVDPSGVELDHRDAVGVRRQHRRHAAHDDLVVVDDADRDDRSGAARPSTVAGPSDRSSRVMVVASLLRRGVGRRHVTTARLAGLLGRRRHRTGAARCRGPARTGDRRLPAATRRPGGWRPPSRGWTPRRRRHRRSADARHGRRPSSAARMDDRVRDQLAGDQLDVVDHRDGTPRLGQELDDGVAEPAATSVARPAPVEHAAPGRRRSSVGDAHGVVIGARIMRLVFPGPASAKRSNRRSPTAFATRSRGTRSTCPSEAARGPLVTRWSHASTPSSSATASLGLPIAVFKRFGEHDGSRLAADGRPTTPSSACSRCSWCS